MGEAEAGEEAAMPMQNLTAVMALFILYGCREPDRTNENDVAPAAAAAGKRERSKPREECHDCDGTEGLVFNEMIEAASAAKAACGSYVELDAGKSGLSPSDYRCRR